MNELANFTGNGAQAVASLPADLAIMKLENENIMALAAARPRDHKKIVGEIVAQLDAYPSFAAEAVYAKPVGRTEAGEPIYARGLSIRAAEAVAEAYGYCRVRVDTTIVDADHVKVEATFTDYQKGRIWQDASVVSRFYKTHGGKMARYNEDRFFGVVVRAECSRRIRECILRSVPPGLRSELMTMADRKVDELLDDNTIQKIIAQFSTKGVSLADLERHIGRTRTAGWTKDDRRGLLELWNAIADGHVTVREAFGKADPEQESDDHAAPPSRAAAVASQARAAAGQPRPEEERRSDPPPHKPPAADTRDDLVRRAKAAIFRLGRGSDAVADALVSVGAASPDMIGDLDDVKLHSAVMILEHAAAKGSSTTASTPPASNEPTAASNPRSVSEPPSPSAPNHRSEPMAPSNPNPNSGPSQPSNPDATNEPQDASTPTPSSEPPKRKRGRPRKNPLPEQSSTGSNPENSSAPPTSSNPSQQNESGAPSSPDDLNEPARRSNPPPTSEPDLQSNPQMTTEPDLQSNPQITTEPSSTSSPSPNSLPDEQQEPKTIIAKKVLAEIRRIRAAAGKFAGPFFARAFDAARVHPDRAVDTLTHEAQGRLFEALQRAANEAEAANEQRAGF